MDFLPFISNEKLITIVKKTLNKAVEGRINAEKKFHKNVIDPMSPLFEMSGFDFQRKEDWIASEKHRQAQKTLSNAVGLMHQRILGSMYEWEDAETGKEYDLLSTKKKIIAEVKNKFNTVNSGGANILYKRLENLVMPKNSVFKDYTAYHVQIISKKPDRYNKPYVLSDSRKGKRFPENELIRVIDGASFYDLASGYNNALQKLYSVLPDVIESISLETLGKNYTFSQDTKNHLQQLFNTAYVKA